MKNNTKTAVINISKKRIERKNFQLKVSSAKRNKVKDIFFPAVCFFQVYHRSLRVISVATSRIFRGEIFR